MRTVKSKLVVGILAHVDAGKTTLSEAFLFAAGKLRKRGRVDTKDAFLDTDEVERERGITIYSKEARFEVGDTEIVLADTPGHVDFSAETERVLQVLDCAVLLVSASKQVTFAAGNLQYTRSSNTWAFAATQYEAIGTGNTIDYELADKIDLFGWSADNTKAPFGVSSALVNPPYAGDFVDWGVNTIGADAPNTWRTLTYEEWQYLLGSRTNATQLMGVARINLNESGTEYTNGLILLPDDWTCPNGIAFKSGFAAVEGAQEYANYQTFTLAQWQRLEAAGAVFLPAAGLREAAVNNVGIGGYYWSATANDTDGAKGMYFLSNTVRAMEWKSRYYGRSVRLVKDL